MRFLKLLIFTTLNAFYKIKFCLKSKYPKSQILDENYLKKGHVYFNVYKSNLKINLLSFKPEYFYLKIISID